MALYPVRFCSIPKSSYGIMISVYVCYAIFIDFTSTYCTSLCEENQVNEERLVLQHIGEILDDYQKYQQMSRANSSTSGVPTSSENRWIQRCLVLLSIATLTRKVLVYTLYYTVVNSIFDAMKLI